MRTENAISPISGTGSGSRPSGNGPSGGGQGIDVRLVPDLVAVELFPAQVSGTMHRLYNSLYHPVSPRPGALVTVTNPTDTPRRVRMSVENAAVATAEGSAAGAFNPATAARWHFALRQPPELSGGAALSAQDTTAPGGESVTLLVLPGERREATLEFAATLDGSTAAMPGAYRFTLVATDANDPESGEQTDGVLILRHPASEMLDMLPRVYRETMDELAGGENGLGVSSGFAGGGFGGSSYTEPPFFVRFLRGFEDIFDVMRGGANRVHLLFGSDTAPPDFLPWLAGWVALSLDENWSEMRCRRLIKEAVELYRWRGTRRGLTRFLQIYTGATPRIMDQPFVGMRLGGATAMGGAATRLGNVKAHSFTVVISIPPTEPHVSESTIRAIIDAQKPAHTSYELNLLAGTGGAGTTEVAAPTAAAHEER